MKQAASTLAVIVARAGSKRFPNKNRNLVCGVPMLQWQVRAIRAAGEKVRDVVVSTDDERLQALAYRLKCHVVKRPADLASDTATIDAAVRHAYSQWCDDRLGDGEDDPSVRAPDFVAVVQCNCPVWKPGTVAGIIARIERGDCTAVLTAHKVREQPEWMHVVKDGFARYYVDPGRPRPYRQQELPAVYRFDGQVVAVRAEVLFEAAGQYAYDYCGPRKVAFIRDWIFGLDVDEPCDLPLVEAAIRFNGKHLL